MKGKSHAWLKENNSKTILNVIFKQKQISRKDLAAETGLTPSAVSRLTSALIEDQLICETGVDKNSKRLGGPVPRLLSINDSFPFVLAVHIGVKSIGCALFTLSAKVLDFEEYEVPEHLTLDELIKMLDKGLSQILVRMRVEKNDILAIGVDISGYVNQSNGIVYSDRIKCINGIALERVFSEYFQMPVYVDNIVHSMALAELLFDEYNEELENFAFIYLGGICGLAFGLDGRIFNGSHGFAGYLLECSGLSENEVFLLSTESLRHYIKYRFESAANRQEAIKGIANLENIKNEDVIAAAMAGNAICQEVLEKRGEKIGDMAAYLTNILDIDRVILTSPLTILPDEEKRMQAAFRQKKIGMDREAKIIVKESGRASFITGAAALAIHKVLLT